MPLPVTLAITAAATLIALWLVARVSQVRLQRAIMTGDGGDPLMAARMRAHANFAEHAPFVLLLIGLIEFGGGSSALLWIVGAAFLLARIAHPFGMERPSPNPWRAGGALVTWLAMAVLAGWALWLVLAPARAIPHATPVDAAARA